MEGAAGCVRAALIAVAVAVAVALGIGALAPAALEAAPPPRQGPPQPTEPTPHERVQKEADRHFVGGVALYREAKYAEALDEFQRAYGIAPHPLVLFNIAECHRALLHYAEAVAAYRQFLVDGNGRVPAARLATAQTELDALLGLIARVTVTIAPANADAVLILDGKELDRPVMPLILPPGEHRLIARAAGRRDAARSLTLSAGDALAVELELGELPTISVERVVTVPAPAPAPAPAPGPSLALDLALEAGFGMNLRRLGKTGAPSVGVGAAIGSRFGVGVDFVLVAYAVVPSIRVRVVGDALSLHVIGAVPIALSSNSSGSSGDAMSGSFVTLAGGLAVRYRATPRLAVRLESYLSLAGADHDTAIPTFLGAELWF